MFQSMYPSLSHVPNLKTRLPTDPFHQSLSLLWREIASLTPLEP